MDRIVEVHGLGRRYGKRWALRGVDLGVRPGEMVGVVGADGSGKTTLLQICAAILDPSEGRCRVLGFDSVSQSSQITARIGYMSQGFTLYDRLSAEENLRFSAQVRGVTQSDYASRRERLLGMAGLGAFVDRPAGKLSGGMRKKLSLCTNLIHEPRLLILDEPGLGVDPLSRRELWTILEAFRDQGATILVSTSYMDEADRCDRVLLLRNGTVLAADRPAAVRAEAAGRVFELEVPNPTLSALELARDPDLFGVQVLPDRIRFQLSARDGIAARSDLVAQAHEATPTLEDVFVLHAGPSESVATAAAGRLAQPAEIRADQVTVRFGDFVAVDHVSLEAAPGTMLALVGPNGAGKTTLIRAFCGLQPVSDGAAWIGSERVVSHLPEQRRHVGYMSQRFSLYSDLTLGENLTFFAAAYGLEREAAAEAIRWAQSVTQLGTEDDDVPVASMSGATRQRLALACSIVHRPAVLFLDEPTSGVDPVSRYRFWQLIRMLAAAGMVVVVTTHYLDEAAYCDRIGLMHRGRLIALGALSDLREQEGVEAGASVETVFVHAIRRAGLALQ